VTGHGRPSLNTFFFIEHHPCILQIITQLHLWDQTKTRHSSIDGHLEQINLLPSLLTMKTTILNIVVTKQCFQFENIIKGARIIETML
jgi:hypothetical protein